MFSNQLLALSENLEDTPPFFREELKKEFYRWINATGLDINNCPERLKHILHGMNEVLEGHGEKIQREVKKNKDSLDSVSAEYKDWMVEQNVRGINQIAKIVDNECGEFHFFTPKSYQSSSSPNPTQKTNSQIIQALKNNPQNWRIGEIPTEIDEFGRVKNQEFVLIHRDARLDDFNQAGKLIFASNPIFRANQFNQAEIEEINKSLSSYQEQEHLASLIKQRKETKDKIQGKIAEIIRFKTWWSNYNVATVINYYEGYYNVFVVVYEPTQGSKGEILEAFEINQGYDKNNLASAKSKASELRNELNGDNPILAVHPTANSHTSFGNIIKEPYVIKNNVPCEKEIYYENGLDYSMGRGHIMRKPTSEPNKYFKPLDIVKVKKSTLGNEYYHFGIYLGNEKVCHFTDPDSKKSTDDMRARITNWEDFIKGWWCEGNPEVAKIRPLIPFRHYQEIAKNIAWDEANNFGLRRYCLANNNCEHYVFSRIFGLNYSKQVEERPSKSRENAHRQGLVDYGSKCYECRQGRINNGENDNFVLKDRLNRSFNKTSDNYSQELERKYEIEVPPKDNCQIM